MGSPSVPRLVGLSHDEAAHRLPTKTLHAGGPRLVRDAALLEQLYRLPLDAAIDPALFQLVAVLLAHVLAVNQHIRETAGRVSAPPANPTG
jgi:type III secretion system FlhB-like substrate exporter